MKILHFSGKGYGFMSGISEFVVFINDEDDVEEQGAPGFELVSETEIDDMPGTFPMHTTLIPLR